MTMYTETPLGVALEALTPTLTKLELSSDEYVRWVAGEVFDTLHRWGPDGTMKSWMQDHHGAVCETVQVDINSGSAWCPTNRTIDARSHSTYVSMLVGSKGSRRDYAKMRVVAVKSNVIVVVDDWHAIAYIVQPEDH